MWTFWRLLQTQLLPLDFGCLLASGTCFQTGKIAVFDMVSSAQQYASTLDCVAGCEGLACVFIPLKAPTQNAVIGVLIAAFEENFP